MNVRTYNDVAVVLIWTIEFPRIHVVCHAIAATFVFVSCVCQWHKGGINFSAHLC